MLMPRRSTALIAVLCLILVGTVSPDAIPEPDAEGKKDVETMVKKAVTKGKNLLGSAKALFGIGQKKSCPKKPRIPAKSELECSTAQCQAKCEDRYRFPNGKNKIMMVCDDSRGEWFVQDEVEWPEIPDCLPVCKPPCRNKGICIGPGVCKCPPNFSGQYCERELKKCSRNPIAPGNAAVICGPEDCTAKCKPGYAFPKTTDPTPLRRNSTVPAVASSGRRLLEVKLKCQGGDIWAPVNTTGMPSTLPDCELLCQPECLNSGVCLPNNKCECPHAYRGDRCQHPITNCDIQNANFGGLSNCTHGPNAYQCTVSCPEGFVFASNADQRSGEFSCDYGTGRFSTDLPSCVPAPTPEPPKPKPGKCQLWGGRNYLTYDGSLFSFEGDCNYRIVETRAARQTFSIDVETRSACSGDPQDPSSPSCFKAVLINLQQATYKLYFDGQGNPVFENPYGVEEQIPARLPGGESLEIVADTNVVFSAPDLDVTFVWKSKGSGSIEVGTALWNQTAGLCGTLDGFPEDVSSVASAGLDLASYVTNWQIDGSTFEGLSLRSQGASNGAAEAADQCTDPIPVDKCSKIGDNDVLADEGARFCQLMLTDATFAACHKLVDPMPFVGVCMEDYCTCASTSKNKALCGCSTMEVYMDACKYAGGTLGERWRKDICPMDCGKELVYSPCVSESTKTCDSVDEIEDEKKVCLEGCTCPSGLVLAKTETREQERFDITLRNAKVDVHSGKKCVKPEACPCFHHGQWFDSGSTMEWDCNTCQCESGTWTCTHQLCGARCAIVGDPHYCTFDRRMYDFMGKCSYYLVKGEGFSIQAENVACSGRISQDLNFPPAVASQMPSCTKSVSILANGTVLKLQRNHEIFEDGFLIKERYPIIKPTWVINKVSDNFVVVELKNGFEVWWDGFSQLYVDAPAGSRGTFSGLCGTFNDNPNDDFKTPEGDVETVANDFGNRWKVDPTCPDQRPVDHPCPAGSSSRKTAEKHCSIILDSIFADCQREVDPRPYFENCVYDTCSCTSIGRDLKECLCPAISSYGNECSRKGLHIDWRGKQRLCGMHCQAPRTFQVCANKCESSCASISLLTDCRPKCVEGCNCPPGMTEDEHGDCISIASCPCHHKGRKFERGSKELRPGEYGLEICECYYGRWKCATARPDELTAMSTTVAPILSCNHTQVFTPCERPEKLTCKNMHYLEDASPSKCYPGCECGKGLVLNEVTGECIEPNQCPCHHAGQSFSQGETIRQECNTCSCNRGKWTCTNLECSGVCSVWGPSHYKTFDGKIYDFDGSCSYMLAKGKLSSAEMFEVMVQNEGCVGPRPSGSVCARHITIKVGIDEEKEVYQLRKHDDDDSAKPAFIEVFTTGLFRVAIVPELRLAIYWDKGTRVYIEAEPIWKGKLKGLCGDFNGNAEDDYKTPSGGSPEKLPEIFGDSWRTQYRCPMTEPSSMDSCKTSSKRLWARQKCGIMKSSVFRPCHSEVPVDSYIERCEQDACSCDSGGDCECLCTAIAAYAQECARAGAPIRWRSQELCPLQCDAACAEYSTCVSPCPMKTCSNYLNYEEIKKDVCFGVTCLEGCQPKKCSAEEVYTSSWKCLSKHDCLEPECMISANGTVYYEGDEIERDPCHVCHCSMGQKICRGEPCKHTITTLAPIQTTTEREPTRPSHTSSCLSGWTDWINNDHPVPYKKADDEEPFDIDWRKVHRYPASPICPASSVTQIECRTAGTHLHPKATGQNVECSLERGLVCKGTDADQGRCSDYEIRIFCQCGDDDLDSTTTPSSISTPPPSRPKFPPISCDNGWTQWMNSHRPDEFGEFELVDFLREKHSFCPNHALKSVECRPVASTASAISSVGICDIKSGYRCIGRPSDAGRTGQCVDHEIRVNCECDCLGPLGMENQLIAGSNISVSSSESLGTWGLYARLNGASAWIPATSNPSQEWLKVDIGRRMKLTGLLIQGHPVQPWWVSTLIVEVSNDSVSWVPVKADPESHVFYTELSEARKTSQILFPEASIARFISIVPTAFVGKIAVRLEILGCPLAEGPSSIIQLTTMAPVPRTSPAPTTTLGPPLPSAECVNSGWTQWMSAHTPAAINQDEAETFRRLRTRYSFCRDEFIGAIQCRPKDTSKRMQLGVTCDLNTGFYCNAYLQDREGCLDYEVMVRCDCWKGQMSTTTVRTARDDTVGYCDPARPNRPVRGKCGEFEHCDPKGSVVEWVPKVCGPGTWYNPETMVCDWPDSVAQIRDDCEYEYEGGTTLAPVTTTAPCEPGKIWNTCAYPCNRLCGNFRSFLQQHGFCLNGEECAPGCLSRSSTCPSGQIFIDSDNCVEPRQCPCATEDGNLHHPGSVWQNGCEVCQCLDGEFVCDRSACPTVKPTPRAWKPSTTVAPVCDQWTPWLNNSHPQKTLVEAEHFSHEMLRSMGYCTVDDGVLSAIECRDAASKKPFGQTPDVGVTCDLSTGLVCQQKRQPAARSYCSDFEVRYYCTCPTGPATPKTTTPYTLPTSTPLTPAAHCPSDYVSLIETLPESAFGSSSSLSRHSGPHMGSIFAKGTPGGWIPAASNADQFLQIDFGSIQGVHGVEIASDSPRGFVKSYTILLSEDGTLFHPLIDPKQPGQPLVIRGQVAFDRPAAYYFDPPFETRFLRINPLSWENRIELMVDVFGCADSYVGPTTPVPSAYDQCPDEMGLSNGKLSASQLAVSSMTPLTELTDIRIGASRFWEPAIADRRQFIKIDFLSPRNLSGVSFVSIPEKLVTQIEVKYSHDGVNWNVAELVSTGRSKRSAGPAIRHRVVFPTLLRCRYLMITPLAWTGGISMQIEVHGCYEPYPESTTARPSRTTPRTARSDDCLHCPGYQLPAGQAPICNCPSGHLWDGKRCLLGPQCPCFVQHYEYAVGASFYTEKCEECLCKLGGVVECLPKNCSLTQCPEANSQKILVNDKGKCSCSCRPCPTGKRLCPTSNECIDAKSWCDGVRDCADDEKDCPVVTTTTQRPTTTSTPTTTTVASTTPAQQLEAYCYSMGRTIRTFDGSFYKYDVCENTMLTDAKRTFNVKLRRVCASEINCWKVVVIDFQKHELILHHNFTIQFDGEAYSVAQVQRITRRAQVNLDILKMGNSVIVIMNHPKLGSIRLIWNAQQHLRIKVTGEALSKTLGLCGTFDENPANEYKMPEGGVALVSQAFADSWGTPGRVCAEPMVCPANLQQQGWEFCQKIREEPFTNCQAHLSVDQFASQCAETACQCLRNAEGSPWKVAHCKCNALMTFAAACLAVAEEDPDTQSISTWRTAFDCPAQCPRGFVHYDCQPDTCLQTCEAAIAANGFDKASTCASNYTLETEGDAKICFPGCYCPDGLVEKEGTCVPPKSCLDLSCDVFESGHMLFTFDRARYPLRGNCSYVLAQDKPEKKFQVILINQCEAGKSNCFKGLVIKSRKHEILVLKNETLIDGAPMHPAFGYQSEWLRVTATGGTIASVHLLQDEVEIQFTSVGLQSFNVRLSSHAYRGKVEGLCGDADGNHLNDVAATGVGDKDNKIAKQAQFTGKLPAKLKDSVNHLACAHVPPTNKTSLCSDEAKKEASQICLGLFKPEFEKCHALENPQRYVDICEQELCQMGAARLQQKVTIACRIFTQYAARCSHLGVCLEWRTSEFCPLSCSNGRQYESCHDSCSDTCPTEEPSKPEDFGQVLEVDLRLGPKKPKYLEHNCKQSIRTEGCFCPPGQLFSTKRGQCVLDNKCVPCDDEEHFPGDQWKPDPCTECSCSADSNVQCSIKDCAKPPICERGQELMELEKAPDECCPQYECRANKISEKVCDLPPKPICNFGQIMKLVELEGQCPFYSCECLPPKDCPTPEPILDLLPGEEAVENHEGCCPKLEKKCNKRKCPIVFPCPTFFTAGIANGTEHLCCPTRTCDPPKEACIFQHTYRADNKGNYVKLEEFLWETKLHSANETWQDGPCNTCDCRASTDTTYSPVCLQEACESADAYADDYVVEARPVPGQCCPQLIKTACKHNGETKAIGSSRWPSEKNKCEDFACRKSSSDDAEIIRVAKDCQRTCDLGWEYHSPAQLGPNYDQCCGKCVKVACVDDKGALRLPNTTWASKDGCYNYRCVVNANGQMDTVGGKKDCPFFDSKCRPESIKTSADGCCKICNTSSLSQVNCAPTKIQNPASVLRTDDPRSPGRLCQPAADVSNVKQCLGHCESNFIFSPVNSGTCTCCRPTSSVPLNVTWVCPDGYRFFNTVESASKCDCQPCSGADRLAEVPAEDAPLSYIVGQQMTS